MSLRRALLAGLVVLALVLARGCGGSGGGGGGKKGGKRKHFIVRTVDPRDGMGSIPNDASVTVFLSAAVAPASLSKSTFYVAPADDPAVSHPGFHTVSDDGLRLKFTPQPWFETATLYDVTVTTELNSLEGKGLLREFRASFTTGPWPSPDPVNQSQFRVVPARMTQGRSSHTQTTLDTGFVLLAGGWGSGTSVTATAEVFDPDREEFFPTANQMRTPRGSHTATRLQSGLVLIVGGESGVSMRGQSTAELFAPTTHQFLDTTPMSVERTSHSATLLPDGKVLVIGGKTKNAQGETVWHRSAEIYEPISETWTATGNDMELVRAGHRATLLDDGRILVTGGSGTRVAEIYDPATDRFSTLESRMIEIRSLHGAVRFPNGSVLLTDGGATTGELFEPSVEVFAPTSNKSNAKRWAAATFRFRDEEVLIVHGINFDNSFLNGSMEQYVQSYGPGGRYFHISPDPDHGVFLEEPRAFAAASALADGRFLITGGLGLSFESPDLNTAVLFDPREE
ncbi:MAG: Ig-like domain-containing protein [Planctomycetota bacterium]|jgi:hypothetical protein